MNITKEQVAKLLDFVEAYAGVSPEHECATILRGLADFEPVACGGREHCGRFPFCGCGSGCDDELPELDPAKPTTEQGVYRKFNVTRVHPSEKHKNCEYFVLDVDHDEYAPAALAAYAKACRATHPDLSDDIMNRYFASPQAAQTEAPLRAMDFHELKNHVFPISGKPR